MTTTLSPGAMDELTHAGLHKLAKEAENVGRALQMIQASVRAFEKSGWPETAHVWATTQIPELQRIRERLMRSLPAQAKGTDLHSWQQATIGLGPALFLVVGLLPPLSQMHSVGAVWKYCGLHVADGRAPRAKRGEKLGFSKRMRSYAIIWMADPATKNRACPYRAVYDARRARTAVSHPVMLEKGGGCASCDKAIAEQGRDCASFGGIHWSAKHQHMDGLRVTAKAILRDAWRVDRGLPARFSAPLTDAELFERGEASATVSMAPDAVLPALPSAEDIAA